MVVQLTDEERGKDETVGTGNLTSVLAPYDTTCPESLVVV